MPAGLGGGRERAAANLPWNGLPSNQPGALAAACGSSYVIVASPLGSPVCLSRYSQICRQAVQGEHKRCRA